MKLIKILSLFALCASLAQVAVAQQKIGYVNTQAVVALLPVTQKANEELAEMRNKFLTQEQSIQTEMKAKYDDLVAKNEAGQLTPSLENLGRQELAQLEQDLVDHRRQMQETLSKRQSVLFKPILKQVNETIQEVSKSEGYAVVFDSSESGIVYGDIEYNLTEGVLLALGVDQATIDEARGSASAN